MTVGWNWMNRWEFKRMLKCKHEWHCAFSSETGTCIIKDAGRQTAHKKTTKIHVLYVLKVNIYFQPITKLNNSTFKLLEIEILPQLWVVFRHETTFISIQHIQTYKADAKVPLPHLEVSIYAMLQYYGVVQSLLFWLS